MLIFISVLFILCEYSFSLAHQLYDSQRNADLKAHKCKELKVCVPTDHGLILENVRVGSCLQILAAWRNLTGTAKGRGRHQCRTAPGNVSTSCNCSSGSHRSNWMFYECNDQAEICSVGLVSLILKTSLLAQEWIAFSVEWVPLESHFL